MGLQVHCSAVRCESGGVVGGERQSEVTFKTGWRDFVHTNIDCNKSFLLQIRHSSALSLMKFRFQRLQPESLVSIHHWNGGMGEGREK